MQGLGPNAGNDLLIGYARKSQHPRYNVTIHFLFISTHVKNKAKKEAKVTSGCPTLVYL